MLRLTVYEHPYEGVTLGYQGKRQRKWQTGRTLPANDPLGGLAGPQAQHLQTAQE